jgi:CubicO group peptidase (beta-lactamase class C family)
MTAKSTIHGRVAPGYEAVHEAFESNFVERGELGAAFAAVKDGQVVTDLWGGVADPATGREWQRDSLQLIFSGTKGIVATCLLMLADRGLLDLEAPVARYWPDFAAAGKAQVLVKEVASHQARLPAFRAEVDGRALLDDVSMAAALAGQPQERDPRAAFAYHPLTYGWLCGELIRRVAGVSVGSFVASQIAQPLGLDLWIGLPPSLEPRVSTLSYAPDWGRSLPTAEQCEQDELLARLWTNPPLFPPGLLPWNTAPYHQAEIPAANAIGTARSIARLYGALARGGELGGVRLLGPEVLSRGTRPLVSRRDSLRDDICAYGIGFELQTELRRLGPPDDAFGHSGAGGSCHGAWPGERIGFSYAMNQLRDSTLVDPRSAALLDALHNCARSSS